MFFGFESLRFRRSARRCGRRGVCQVFLCRLPLRGKDRGRSSLGPRTAPGRSRGARRLRGYGRLSSAFRPSGRPQTTRWRRGAGRRSAHFTVNGDAWSHDLAAAWPYRSATRALYDGATSRLTGKPAGENAVPLPLKLHAASPISLQTQIFEQVRSMILEGRLRPGEALPSTRTLSEQFGIARNTTALAYDRLAAEGYIETRRSVGTFISMQIPEGVLYTATHRPASPARSTKRSAVKSSGPPARSQALVNPNRRRFVADFWVGAARSGLVSTQDLGAVDPPAAARLGIGADGIPRSVGSA
jgi:DNA-binding transcriptional regulator YhcF (GntR family)